MAERNRYLIVDVVDPEGRKAGPLEARIRAGESSFTVRTRETVAVPEGPLVLELDRPAGRWNFEAVSRSPEAPTRITLRAAELLVWLGDPGGRDFGGLPVVARGEAGEARGRIGAPLLVWAGAQTITVGDPLAGVAPQTLLTDVQPPRATLELGRLASLVVSWGEGRGWPLRAVQLEGGLPVSGRVGEPMTLWPGRYRLEVDGGPTREVQLRAGRLHEIDLARPAGPTLDTRVEEVVDLAREALTATGEVLEKVGAGPLGRVVRRLVPSATAASRGGDLRAALRTGGDSVRLQLRDARGYALTGWPIRLEPVAGELPLIEGRVGGPIPVTPGRYRVTMLGVPGVLGELEAGTGETGIELPAMGGLEVILRDGQGASLRGAVYRLRGTGGELEAGLSQIRPVVPGLYDVTLPTTPPIRRAVEVKSGEVTILDLGALGRLDISAGPDAPWGTPVWIELEGSGAADDGAPVSLHSQVGGVLHLPVQSYRVWVGRREGEGERFELRPGRMRRPTVVGRGFEALAHDDANRV